MVIRVEGVAAAHADEASIKGLRDVVRAQLEAVAALPDGFKALTAFDERVRSRIFDVRRSHQKRLETPPEFGARKTADEWVQVFDDVTRAPGFRKSLTYRDGLLAALAAADPAKNAWRDRVRAWGLLDAPYAIAARPSPALRARLD